MRTRRSLWYRNSLRGRIIAIAISVAVFALLLVVVAARHGDLRLGIGAGIPLAVMLVGAMLSFRLGFTRRREEHIPWYQQTDMYSGIVYTFLFLAILMVMGVAANLFDGFVGFRIGIAFLAVALLYFLLST